MTRIARSFAILILHGEVANMSLSIRYSSPEHSFLCFRHAVTEAMKGAEVRSEFDEDAGSEYDMRSSTCALCYEEWEREESKR